MESNETTESPKRAPISLRQISSLDGSEVFPSLKEKLASLRGRKAKIEIPSYPESPVYHPRMWKRLWARARYFCAILRQRLSGRDYPVIAILVVNNKCNWNCTYCFGDYPNRREVDYTTDELKFLVDELYSMGVRYVNVHGGETLLRQDIGDICRYIKHKGMYLCVITNGSLLERKLKDILCVDNLTISLDGARAGNDYNRGTGTFDITLRAIRLAMESGIPLRVQATLTRQTMHDVGYLAKLAKKYGFQLQFSILFKPLKKARESQMTNREIRATLQEIRKFKRLGYPIFTSERAIQAAYEWPYDYNKDHHVTEARIPGNYKSSHIPCFYSRNKFTIEADGYVYPCFLTTDGSFKPKNWREVGLATAIKEVQTGNLCRACPALTQNDHNLLLGMNVKQITSLIGNQIREVLVPRTGCVPKERV